MRNDEKSTDANDPLAGRLLLTIASAGKATSRSRSTIHRLITTGRLETVKIGRSRLITASSIRKLAQNVEA